MKSSKHMIKGNSYGLSDKSVSTLNFSLLICLTAIMLPNAPLKIYISSTMLNENEWSYLKTDANETSVVKIKKCCYISDISAVVGPTSSTISTVTSNIFSLYDIPQISHASTSRLLSDKSIYK